MANFSERVRDGRAYMKKWPAQRVLAPMFPENRVIAATTLAMKTMPAIAVLTVILPFSAGMHELLPQAVMMAMVIFLMPLHGLFWLGQRANTHLPRSLASWYRELHEKLAEAGVQLAPAATQPRYFELAEALNAAFRRFDKSFLVDD
ncbi:terminus macrodomain insulation protein YfbV [Aliagarivorans taiwanensis]|uniref:terminus macrodomain insulation protein YfbV n=1 Tax=Aliagarivorans taiwanensis TaxID=561966 RepID=UPI00047D02F0|nr:terminus macrodomain insulation protein YfbV [Aliagarivorans taiwanensis]